MGIVRKTQNKSEIPAQNHAGMTKIQNHAGMTKIQNHAGMTKIKKIR